MFSEEMPEASVNPEDGNDSGEAADAEVHAPASPVSGENLANAPGQTLTPDNDLNFTQEIMEVKD